MRTQALLDRIVHELTHNCGDEFEANRVCGVSAVFVSQWRKDDAKVDETIREACRIGTQGLVSAAIQRATKGVEEDVYHRGEVVGQKMIRSDSLLLALLKAKVDEFKAGEQAGTNVTVNVANIMPRANTYEEWLAMRGATISPKLTDMSNFAKAVMAPPGDEVIDGAFKVTEPAFAGINL